MVLTFKTYFLTEGGAAGHMAHPFDLPNVRTGKDLINFFNKAANSLKREKGVLKIDGVNVSIKLVNKYDKLQFAIDRGSMKPLDVEGVTVKDLIGRFGEGHGLIAAGKKTLEIMNASIPDIMPELEKLGLLSDPTLFFNTEFVQGQTNVLSYDHDFLAIHGINKFIQITPKKRTSDEIFYDKAALNKLIDKVNKVANQHNFKIYGEVGVSFIKAPNYSSVLSHPFSITINNTKTSEPLSKVLQTAVNPFGDKIQLTNGKIVGALSKEVYTTILNGTPVDEFVKDKKDYQKAIDGAAIYHGTRVLGAELLRTLKSDMGSADKHEGVVLRDNSISPKPVKITGDFIISGMKSPFKGTPEEGEEGENFDSPYLDQKGQNIPASKFAYPGWGSEGRMLTPKPATFNEMADMVVGRIRPEGKRVLVIYPGRFQPFHKGHAGVYNKLKQEFPEAQVYIATSDKVEPPKSPFNFEDKTQMILASGVDPSVIVKTSQPYIAPEIVNKYSKSDTIVIFAVGKKDMEGPDARFKFGVKRDGSPSFFQKFKDIESSQPVENHGYIMEAPTVTFNVNGKPVKSASEIRQMYKSGDDKARKSIITDLYGKYSPEIKSLLDSKIG
jgi:cytidyltransferase-like protein